VSRPILPPAPTPGATYPIPVDVHIVTSIAMVGAVGIIVALLALLALLTLALVWGQD
jgi:hypothetical protein